MEEERESKEWVSGGKVESKDGRVGEGMNLMRTG